MKAMLTALIRLKIRILLRVVRSFGNLFLAAIRGGNITIVDMRNCCAVKLKGGTYSSAIFPADQLAPQRSAAVRKRAQFFTFS